MENIKEYTARKKAELKEYIETLTEKPKLVIIQVGTVEASNRYVRNKIKDCEECLIPVELKHFDEAISEADLLIEVERCNKDDSVTGFIVQLPLPKHISEQKIIDTIDYKKDVDGFSKLAITNAATPQGAIDFLEDQKFNFVDKNAVVIGRSHILGAPLSRMLLERSCNITTLHSKTSEANKRMYLENADIIFAAAGVRNLINKSYKLKPTAIVIDFGMNFDENGKLCGDCERDLPVAFQSVCPGGTGLTTRLALITNLIKLYEINKNVEKFTV